MTEAPLPLTDEQLVQRFLERHRRDDAVFSEILRRRRADVWRICYAFFGNRQDAEDMTQEVFFTAFRKLDQFRGESSLRTWLSRVATNACKNEIRARMRRPLASHSEPYDDALLISSTAPDDGAAMNEGRRRLARALTALSDTQREVLLLAGVEGRSYAEIADRLGLTVSAVKMRVLRARLALQAAYLETGRRGAHDDGAT